jgi:hypothetical protein
LLETALVTFCDDELLRLVLTITHRSKEVPERVALKQLLIDEQCLDPLEFNIPRARRMGVLADRRHGNGAFYPMVCGDPEHQVQTESARPGAKGLLHIG